MNKNYRYQGLGLTTKERNQGRAKFCKYQKVYLHLHKLSDLQLLEHLVFLEILEERYKIRIGELSKNKAVKDAGIIPSALLKGLNENSAEIIGLKEKLGLFADKEKLSPFQDFKDSEKKFEIYRENHPLEFKTTCCFCAKIYFLKRRTKDFEPHASPFFNGGSKILNNPEIMDLYHKGIITKEQAAKAHGTSPDYMDWLDDKFYKTKKAKVLGSPVKGKINPTKV